MELEEKCIWMSSGLVLYKLCDRKYECATCPFDQAMRGEFEETKAEEPSFFSIELSNFYHPNHIWVKIETPKEVLLGIDSFLSSFICYIRTIVFPKVGESFSQDEYFCHIVEKRGIIPLVSPISGTVLAINLSIEKYPEYLTKDPFKSGFLLKMRPENLERDIRTLFFGKEAIEWLKREEGRLFSLLSSFQGESFLGQTMQDGGTKVTFLISELTEKEYLKLIDSFIKTHR